MSATAIFSNSITNASINNGVLSYDGSKVFIQKLIPTAIGLILYQRTDIDRSNFEKRDCNGLKFTTFKKIVTNKSLKEICRWCMGALDAFKKEYLKELHLMFVDIHDTFNVLESYKFHFEYIPRKSPPEKVSKDTLKTAVGELFGSISKINVAPLKEVTFIPYMCISYNDNVPLDYEPPYFKMDTHQDDLVNHLASKCREYIRLKQVTTGFHAIQSQCNVPGWNSTEEEKSVQEMNSTEQTKLGTNETVDNSVSFYPNDQNVIDLSTPQNNQTALTDVNITDNETQMEQESNKIEHHFVETEYIGSIFDGKIECMCLLKKKFFNIDLIECTNCHSLQHAPCVGYLYVKNVGDYTCHMCKVERNDFSRNFFCSFKLLLAHIYFNNEFTYEVCKELKFSLKISLIKMLKAYNVIQYLDDKYVVINNNMDALVEKIFPQNGKINSLEEII